MGNECRTNGFDHQCSATGLQFELAPHSQPYESSHIVAYVRRLTIHVYLRRWELPFDLLVWACSGSLQCTPARTAGYRRSGYSA